MADLLENEYKEIKLNGKKYKFTQLTLGAQADFKSFCKKKKREQVLEDIKDLGDISAREKYEMIQITDEDMLSYYSEPDGLAYLIYLALKDHNEITLDEIRKIDFTQQELLGLVEDIQGVDEDPTKETIVKNLQEPEKV